MATQEQEAIDFKPDIDFVPDSSTDPNVFTGPEQPKVGLLQSLKNTADEFIGKRLHQLSGEESGILNPEPDKNPILNKPFLEPLPRNQRIAHPELFGEDNRSILGKVTDTLYDTGAGMINSLFSPLGIYGAAMDANPADMSLEGTGLGVTKPTVRAVNGKLEMVKEPAIVPKNELKPSVVKENPFTDLQAKVDSHLANIKPSEEVKSPTDVVNSEIGALRLRGKKASEVEQIRNQIIKTVSSGGKLNLNDLYQPFSDRVSASQFGKIVDDILESGDLQRAYESVKAANLAKDTSPMQMAPDETLTEPQALLRQLMSNVKAHGAARIEQDTLTSAAKKERIKAAMRVDTPGLEGYFQQMSKLKGEYPKIQAEIKSQIFTPENVGKLKDMIMQEPGLSDWDRIGAQNALMRATGMRDIKGSLQPSEIQDLTRIFGPKLADDLVELHGGLGLVGLSSPTYEGLVRGGSLAKALKSSTDIAGFFRAGRNYALQKEWRDAFIPSIKSYFSESQSANIIDRLKNDPIINDAREHGLAVTDYRQSAPINREEFFQSLDAEKVPILGRGVRASNRSQTVMNDLIRTAKYKTYMNKYQKVYDSLSKTATTPEELKELARYDPQSDFLKNFVADRVNTATGRGKLGRLEKIAPELNAFGFSPRLASSRMRTFNRVFNPENYRRMDKVERSEILKQALSMAAVSGGFLGASSLLGAKIGLNPLATDFGKAKFGDTRLDPNGGYGQFIVPIARILANGLTTTSGKTNLLGDYGTSTGTGIIGQGIENRESPFMGLATALINRREVTRPNNFTSVNPFENTTTRQLVIPMIAQDIYDLVTKDPSLLKTLAVVPMDAVGIGVQTYGSDDDQELKAEDKAKRDEYRKKLRGVVSHLQ